MVLADYDGNAAGEISANAGDRVKVIKKEESGNEQPWSYSFIDISLLNIAPYRLVAGE